MDKDNYYTATKGLPTGIKMLRFYYKYIGLLFPKLSGWIFWKLFSIPKKRVIREKHQNFLKTARLATIKFENYEIQTYHWGESDKNILIVHGWEGITADFREIISELTNNGFSVTSIDLPAHGNSTGKSVNLPIVSRLVQKMILEHGPYFGIVAHSLGASAAAFATANLNGRLKLTKLVLMGLHPEPFAFFMQFKAAININDSLFNKCVSYVENKLDINIREASIHKIAPSISASQVLLIHDEKDKIAEISNIEKLNQNWGRAELFSGEHGGHFIHYKNSEVVNKIVHFMKQPIKETITEEQMC